MIRVYITEDSDLSAEILRRTLEASSDIRVVGRARSAEELLSSGGLSNVDVVLLDMWLPGRAGLAVVKQITRECAVIIVSDSPESSPVGREAAAQGAAAVFCKADLSNEAGAERLRAAIRNAARGRPDTPHPVVAVVGSTGSMNGMKEVALALRETTASLLVVQHMPVGREAAYAEWITTLGVPSRVARTSDAIEVGRGLVASGEGHMVVTTPHRVGLDPRPPLDGHRPSGTILLQSAAILGSRLIAVVLSGMGRDGADAIPGLIERGATCFVQAPEDCVAPSMPMAALAASAAVRSLRIDRIANHLRRVVVTR